MEPKQVALCQKCFRKHVLMGVAVEEHITCTCGNSFYFVASHGMSLVIPEEEAQMGNVAILVKKLLASTGRGYDAEAGQDEYTAVLREAAPERLLGVSLARLQEETYGMNIVKANNVVALCEFLNKGMDVAVKYKEDKDRIVITKLGSTDMMAEWDKKHEGVVPRAGDKHYQPGEWADWQIKTEDQMEYFRKLGAQHKKSG